MENLPQREPQQNRHLGLSSNLTSPIIQLLRANQPALTSVIAQDLTIAKAQNGISFSKMRAEAGGALTEMHVVLLLKEAIRFFNASLSDSDLAFYAKRITLDYHYWKIEDLTICLNNGIAGKYGVSMARFTYGDTFVRWATRYDGERTEYYENKHLEDKKGLKDHAVKNLVPVEEIAKLADRFSLPDSEPKKVLPREKTEIDELIDEFTTINKLQSGHASCLGYITFEGRRVDFREFIEARS